MSEAVQREVLSAAAPLVHLQHALVGLGASVSRPPSATGQDPADQLMWGTDSVVAACRLLLCGQIAGAAGIMRSQIETWSSAKAAVAGRSKLPNEGDSDFIAASWSALSGYERLGDVTEQVFIFDVVEESRASQRSHPATPHRHIVSSDGREFCPAAIWSESSELLHGRAYDPAFVWDASCLEPSFEQDASGAVRLVADAIRVVLWSIRLSAIGLARDRGVERAENLLMAGLDDFSERDSNDSSAGPVELGSPPPKIVVPPLLHFAPLTLEEGLAPSVLESLRHDASNWFAIVQGRRPVGRLYRDDEILSISISWVRWRSALSAEAALEQERVELGERFDPRMLRVRATSWIRVTEALSLLGLWAKDEPVMRSLTLLASVLRSGWWLWLEDDDRAMGMFRFALEQVARARVWRLNPEKAAKLELRSTPRDWLKAAGLRRLGPMNKALGDFTHQLPWADLEAGRRLLTGMHFSSDSAEAVHTARRSAAELITAIAAEEAAEYASQYSSSLAAAMADILRSARELLGVEDANDRTIESHLDLIWSFRPSPGESVV